jgi:hypothetical protein
MFRFRVKYIVDILKWTVTFIETQANRQTDGRFDEWVHTFAYSPLVIQDNIKVINRALNYSPVGIRTSYLTITADEILSFPHS